LSSKAENPQRLSVSRVVFRVVEFHRFRLEPATEFHHGKVVIQRLWIVLGMPVDRPHFGVGIGRIVPLFRTHLGFAFLGAMGRAQGNVVVDERGTASSPKHKVRVVGSVRLDSIDDARPDFRSPNNARRFRCLNGTPLSFLRGSGLAPSVAQR